MLDSQKQLDPLCSKELSCFLAVYFFRRSFEYNLTRDKINLS